jgi:hypothetical protein
VAKRSGPWCDLQIHALWMDKSPIPNVFVASVAIKNIATNLMDLSEFCHYREGVNLWWRLWIPAFAGMTAIGY